MRIATCLVLVVGCATSSVAPPVPPAAPAGKEPEARPCPPDLATRLLGEEPPRDEQGEVIERQILECVAGNFPRPGWVALHRSSAAEQGSPNFELSIVEGARVLHGGLSAMMPGPIATADLDGDGVDEVIVETLAGAMFGGETQEIRRIVPYAIRKDGLSQLEKAALTFLQIKAGEEPLYQCNGKHTLEPDPRAGTRLVVIFEPEIGHRDDLTCPSAGRHTYRLAGDERVEVK